MVGERASVGQRLVTGGAVRRGLKRPGQSPGPNHSTHHSQKTGVEPSLQESSGYRRFSVLGRRVPCAVEPASDAQRRRTGLKLGGVPRRRTTGAGLEPPSRLNAQMPIRSSRRCNGRFHACFLGVLHSQHHHRCSLKSHIWHYHSRIYSSTRASRTKRAHCLSSFSEPLSSFRLLIPDHPRAPFRFPERCLHAHFTLRS